MKMCEFCLRFHWSLFLGGQLTIFQHGFRLWLGADQATSHYLNQCWYLYRHIYASLGLNELMSKGPDHVSSLMQMYVTSRGHLGLHAHQAHGLKICLPCKNFHMPSQYLWALYLLMYNVMKTSNGSWCMGIKGEMSGTVCVTFTWDMYIYMSCL